MSLTRLISYVAEVELLGEIRVVEIDSMRGTLTIRGITMEQAHVVLEKLSEGRLKAVAPPAETPEPIEQEPAKVLAMVPPEVPEVAPAPVGSLTMLKGPADAIVAEPVAPTPPAPSADGLPVEVANATRVGDVVKWVTTNWPGATDEAVVEKVQELAARVPLLARVVNLAERVKRQLAVIER